MGQIVDAGFLFFRPRGRAIWSAKRITNMNEGDTGTWVQEVSCFRWSHNAMPWMELPREQ